MQAECSRYRIKPQAHELAREWLAFLKQHQEEVLLTLNDEKMWVEAIFTQVVENQLYFIWFTLQDENGQEVHESSHWVDQVHCEYWSKCIDKEYEAEELTAECLFLNPAFLLKEGLK